MIHLKAAFRRVAVSSFQLRLFSASIHSYTMPSTSNATPPTAAPTFIDSDNHQPSHSPTLVAKRKADTNAHDPTISPPPTKRKVQSTVSKSVVASFFTPTSQKPAAKTSVAWEERAPAAGVPATLLVATFCPEGSRETSSTTAKRRKVAAFDLDSTLITTASGKKHAVNAADWTWWDTTVPLRLRTLYDEGFAIIIFSNQGGLVLHPEADVKKEKGKAQSKPKAGTQDRVASFKQKCAAVLTELGLPTTLYAATGKDRFRKPRPGMWQEMTQDLGLPGEGHEHPGLDLAGSFFVGDAAGRVAHVRNGKLVPKDFSCSDRNLAANVGVRFATPEEYFLGEAPREFARGFDLAEYPFVGTAPPPPPVTIFSKGDGQELVVFCGPPGAGKSTFARLHMEPLGFERVNQDTLKSYGSPFAPRSTQRSLADQHFNLCTIEKTGVSKELLPCSRVASLSSLVSGAACFPPFDLASHPLLQRCRTDTIHR